MTEPYFVKFPVITYNNYQARNITERVNIVAKEKIAPFDFFRYPPEKRIALADEVID
jgi:hypothetical protein